MRDTKSEVAEIRDAVHLCIDMQNIFAPGGLWETPWMARVLPTIVDIVSRHQSRTIFTRFITPRHPEERPGQWQNYFRHWHQATRNHLAPTALQLVPALARYVPPLRIVDKPAYSAFSNPGLASLLFELGVGTGSSQAQKQTFERRRSRLQGGDRRGCIVQFVGCWARRPDDDVPHALPRPGGSGDFRGTP